MTSSDRQDAVPNVSLDPWANLGLELADAELQRIQALEESARPLPPVAIAIRELITRFEICHFKAERHVERIVEAIGHLHLDFDPATIGQAHPRSGDFAWRRDKTGRSRVGQEFIWAMELWLADAPDSAGEAQGIPRTRLDAVKRALGPRDGPKTLLVTALVNRLRLKADRPPLPPEWARFWVPIESTDICHYAFPDHLERMLAGIGRLEPPPGFAGCGSFDEARRALAQASFRALSAWLQGEAGPWAAALGDRTPVKEWLVACLAKTLKELVGLKEDLPFR